MGGGFPRKTGDIVEKGQPPREKRVKVRNLATGENTVGDKLVEKIHGNIKRGHHSCVERSLNSSERGQKRKN